MSQTKTERAIRREILAAIRSEVAAHVQLWRTGGIPSIQSVQAFTRSTGHWRGAARLVGRISDDA